MSVQVPPDKPWRDAETLRHLYQERGLTTREIAGRFGCSNGTVSDWLERHGIEARDNWVAGVEAAKRANRVERATLRTLPSGYEYWSSREWRPGDDNPTSEMVYVHRLQAVAEYGFDAVADADVHHENGIPWDNRPENLTLLSKAEHAREHAEQRVSNADLVADILRLNDMVDGRPTARDLREHGRHSHPTYQDRFGGWREALEVAGITGGDGE